MRDSDLQDDVPEFDPPQPVAPSKPSKPRRPRQPKLMTVPEARKQIKAAQARLRQMSRDLDAPRRTERVAMLKRWAMHAAPWLVGFGLGVATRFL